MGNLKNSYSILSTIAASAADITVSGHVLSIVGCPSFDYRTSQNWGTGFNSSLTETAQVTTVTPTAANSTAFTLYIRQWVPSLGKYVDGQLSYTTAASGDTATTICNNWRSALVAQTGLKITGTGTSTLILTGQTGAPLFTVTNIAPSTTTQSSTVTGVAITASTAVTTGYVGTVLTAVAHGQVTGDEITITSADETKLVSGTYRVVKIDADTYYLRSINGQTALYSSATTTATVVKVAKYSRGTYTDLVAAGVTGATAGSTYAQVPFSYINVVGSLMGTVETEQDRHTMYVLESATNYEAFRVRMIEVYNAYPASGTTSDPKLINMGS